MVPDLLIRIALFLNIILFYKNEIHHANSETKNSGQTVEWELLCEGKCVLTY